MAEKKNKKPRTIWMKKGSYKHLLDVLNGIRRELHELRRTVRYVVMGMQHQLSFDKDYIASIVCRDEVDQAILEMLRNSPAEGLLPRDIASEVHDGTTPWNVTQRIRRMNQKLDTHIGQQVAEKRGLRWCLTSFLDLSWTEEELPDM